MYDDPPPPRLCRVTVLEFSIISPSPIADWRFGDQDVQTVGRELPCDPEVGWTWLADDALLCAALIGGLASHHDYGFRRQFSYVRGVELICRFARIVLDAMRLQELARLRTLDCEVDAFGEVGR